LAVCRELLKRLATLMQWSRADVIAATFSVTRRSKVATSIVAVCRNSKPGRHFE